MGADALALHLDIRAYSTLFFSAQSSSKVYRATRSRFALHAEVGSAATLVLWPDPTTCFAEASVVQSQSVSLAAGASALVVDAWTCGRAAQGEHWSHERLETRLRIEQEGRAVHQEGMILSAEHGSVSARLRGIGALATVVLAGPAFSALAVHLESELAEAKVQSLVTTPLLTVSVREFGVVLRIGASCTEKLSECLAQYLKGPVASLLGDDPWARKW